MVCLVFFCKASAAIFGKCGLWCDRRITSHHSEFRSSLLFPRQDMNDKEGFFI